VQPTLPHRLVPVPSNHHIGILHAFQVSKSGSLLQCVFDCKDEADNYLKLSSMTSVRVSSLLLSAPRSAVDPIWCCSENDQIAPVSQDTSDSSFTAFASIILPGTSYIVPVILSVGAFGAVCRHDHRNDSSGGILATFYNADNFANFSYLVSSKVPQLVLQLPDTPFPLEQQYFSARAFSVLRATESHVYQFVLIKTSATISCAVYVDGIAVVSSKSLGATIVTGFGIHLASESDHSLFVMASG
jgi:hypothetical protein